MDKKIFKFNSNIIVTNKKAHYEYSIQKEIEAGLSLQGWEVKSLRLGKVDISNSYININYGEAFLFGANFTPMFFNNAYFVHDPTRNRKILLNKYELNYLYGCIERKNYTIIILSLYWKNNWCKAKIGIAKSKKKYDKRLNIKKREWNISKSRLIKKIRY